MNWAGDVDWVCVINEFELVLSTGQARWTKTNNRLSEQSDQAASNRQVSLCHTSRPVGLGDYDSRFGCERSRVRIPDRPPLFFRYFHGTFDELVTFYCLIDIFSSQISLQYHSISFFFTITTTATGADKHNQLSILPFTFLFFFVLQLKSWNSGHNYHFWSHFWGFSTFFCREIQSPSETTTTITSYNGVSWLDKQTFSM